MPSVLTRTGWALLVFALCPRGGLAQEARDPLAPPTGALMCKMTPLGTAGFLVQILDWPDPAAKNREIKAAFDSIGTPLLIQVWAPEHQAGRRDQAHVFLAGFVPGAKALRAVGDEDSLTIETDSTCYPKHEATSDSEVARARALADWIWIRRCANDWK